MPANPRLHPILRATVAAAVVVVLAPSAPNARVAETVLYREDLVSVRLSAAALTAIRGDLGPRAAAPQRMIPESGSLGTMARQHGLTLEPEFPAASPSRPSLALMSPISPLEARLGRQWLVHVPPGLTAERAVGLLRPLPEIETAERIALVPVSSAPNDSLWPQSYYLNQVSRRDVHALEAWDITRGDSAEIIAIIDTGILLTHPDLAGPGPGIGGNIWTNAAEANGLPGVDDDGNGYIDDVHGWDFVSLPDTTYAVPGEDWRDEDNDPNDFVGHGTGVAGVAAAITNNRIGAAGAAPLARLMPLRVGYSAQVAPSGIVDESAAARAIVYAARTGATVINCSFSTVAATDLDLALDVAAAAGVTVVTAAGNNGTPHAMADRPEVISVAALDANDRVALFSSTGAYVDVAAAGLFLSTTIFLKVPGADSTTLRVPAYSGTASGTSVSAPLVAAEVALIQADRRAHGLPPMDPGSVQSRIVETADDISAQNPFVTGYGSGRVNFLRALTDPVRSFALRLDSFVVGGAAAAIAADGAGFCVVGTRGGHLVRVDGASRTVRWDATLPSGAGGSPAVADLGAGRGNGIFIGAVSGRVCGFDETGRPLPGWPLNATCPAGDLATPAIADVDGDGLADVVWGDANGRVWAWHADGQGLPGFPCTIGADTSRVSVALADLDGDGIREILAAASDGTLTVLLRDGLPAPGWPRHFTYGAYPFLQGPPMVALLESDPRPAIISTLDAPASSFVDIRNPDGSARGAFDFGSRVAGSSAVADVEGDGARDIVVHRSTQDVFIERGNFTYTRTSNTSGEAPGGSLVPEVIVGNGASGHPVIDWTYRGALFCVDGRSGQPVDPQRFGSGTPTLADLDGDHALELVVPDANAPLLRIYMTGAPEAGNDRLWPTGRGNAARTGCSIQPGETIADVIPPRAVINLRVTQQRRGEVTLAWTAPFEARGGRAARYDLRRSSMPPSIDTFASGILVTGVPVPGAAGVVESCTAPLPTGTSPSYFALVSVDSAGNASAISNVVSAPAVRATAVTDLHVAGASDATLELAWTSTGASGWLGEAASYELRAAPYPLDSTNFAAAPIRLDVPATLPAGGEMTAVLTPLLTGHRYWIAVVAHDSLDTISRLSNVVSGVPGNGLVAPDAVTDLAVTGFEETSLQLAWSSTGHSGFLGQAAAYDIRASEQPLDASNFGQATLILGVAATRPRGDRESAWFSDLTPGHTYWIAMRATDSLGLVSPLSNVVQATTVVPPRPNAVHDLHVTYTTETSITVGWTSTGNDGRGGRAASYDVRASTNPLDALSFDQAEIQRSLNATMAQGLQEEMLLTPLAPQRRYWIAVRVTDLFGNESDVSNVVSATSTTVVTPLAVTDLRVTSVGGSSLSLAWTSTGRNGKAGHAATYDVRAAERPLDPTNFDGAEVSKRVVSTQILGHVQTADLPGLVPGRRYWIALQCLDSLDSRSALSNVVSTVPGPLAGRTGAGIAAAPSPARAPVVLQWQADASRSPESPRIQVVDIGGRLCRTLTAAPGDGGVVRWDGRNDAGASMPAGIYFAHITTRAGTATSRFVLLR